MQRVGFGCSPAFVSITAEYFRVVDAGESGEGEQIVARYIDAAVAQTGGMENGLRQRVPELEILATNVRSILQVARLCNLVLPDFSKVRFRIISSRIFRCPIVHVFFKGCALPHIAHCPPEVGIARTEMPVAFQHTLEEDGKVEAFPFGIQIETEAITRRRVTDAFQVTMIVQRIVSAVYNTFVDDFTIGILAVYEVLEHHVACSPVAAPIGFVLFQPLGHFGIGFGNAGTFVSPDFVEILPVIITVNVSCFIGISQNLRTCIGKI